MIVRLGSTADAGAAAALHAEQIAEGFLPTLGSSFLERLYRRIVRWPRAFLLIADDGGAVIGMAAAAEDVGALYRAFALRDGVPAAIGAAPHLARSWRRVLETARYATEADGLPVAELLSVAVTPAARGRGVGRALVREVNAEFRRRGVEDARVVTAGDNAAALGLYVAEGYRPVAEIEVHAGRVSQVLTWP